MASLTGCLKKHVANAEDKAAVTASAREHRGAGMSASEAGIKAARDLLAQHLAEIRAFKPAKAKPQVRQDTHPATVMGSRLLGIVSKRLGGLDPAWIAEFSTRVETARVGKDGRRIIQWRNPPIPGIGRLFRAGGTQDLQALAETLEEAGYLTPGTTERDGKEAGERAKELVRKALQRDPTPTIDQQMAELEAEMARRNAGDPADPGPDLPPEEDPAYYPEVDPEAAAEMEAEREAIMAEAQMSRQQMDAPDDADLWDGQGHSDTATAMRAMGFSEQEIADELAREEAAQRGAQAGAAEAGAAAAGEAGPAPADRGAAPGSGAAEEGLTLEPQTTEALQAKADREKAAADADRKEQKRLAEKAKADAERGEFVLTGSDRPADVAAAAGQGGLFDGPSATTDAQQTSANDPRQLGGGELAGVDKFYASLIGKASTERLSSSGGRTLYSVSITPQMRAKHRDPRRMVFPETASFALRPASEVSGDPLDRRDHILIDKRGQAAARAQSSDRTTPANLAGVPAGAPAEVAPKPRGADNTIFTQSDAEKARELLRKRLRQLNSGLDPEMMQAGITLAGYHIERGARTFAAYARAMLADLGEAVRPYLKSWYMAAKYDPRLAGVGGLSGAAEVETADVATFTAEADNAPQEAADVPDTDPDLERDRSDAGTADSTVVGAVQGEGSADSAAAARKRSGSSRRGRPDDPGLPAGGAAAARELGDQPVRRGDGQDRPAEFDARDRDGERSDDPGIAGVQPEAVATSQVEDAAVKGLDDAAKRARQREADSTPVVPGDLANVRATLPYLLPGQQEDVHKAEVRFAKPDGYGMLFTNGTGTGKTFTGLGIVKRFVRQGKSDILIVTPDAKIMADWVDSGRALGLTISPLENTKQSGKGVTITTYANLGMNDELARRSWDLIVPDEAHSLMQDKEGTPTTFLHALRAISMHPRGAYHRFAMLNRDGLNRQQEVNDAIRANEKIYALDDTTEMQRASIDKENAKLKAEQTALNLRLNAERDRIKAEVEAAQGAGRTRIAALSATPFAYEKTIDWAEGYLFEYGKANEDGRSYNRGDAREQFFVQHFGYRMRFNKLNEPDAKVDRGLMQRQFNGWLKKQGSLSGRMLDVAADYDRRFVLVESAIGNAIDRALDFIQTKAREADKAETERQKAADYKADKEPNGWAFLNAELSESLYGPMGHLYRRYLLEAIKAKEVIPHVREHLAMGRKVVVFHDFKKGGSGNPFAFSPKVLPPTAQAAGMTPEAFKDLQAKAAAYNRAAAAFAKEFPDLVGDLMSRLISPIARFQQEFPGVLLINGDERKSDLLKRYKAFQDDATGPVVALVQSDKNKGWSGHDTTGKHQRVLFNLGLPTQPTKSIQQEGRIYRTGQVSNAMFRYLNTGTNWERWAFAQTIAERASAAENLGSGELARALKDSFIAGFEESGDYRAGHEGEGTGGKLRDAAANNALSEYDRARAFYFGTQKKDSRTKAQEGADYFATPEPLGLKMVQWADARPGDDALEPSAGHGAIARWLGEKVNRTAIEPSNALGSRLAMVFDGRIIRSDFEDHNVVNKYDAVVMNPPFGSGGRTAIDHLAKAATHLREGGRIVALIPTGPAADAKWEKWFYDEKGPAKDLQLVADIKLPAVTFERAGTKVMTRVVVIEKPGKDAQAPQQINRDLSDIEDINELFSRLENLDLAPRAKPVEAEPFTPPAKVEQVQQQDAAPAADAAVVEHTTQKGKVIKGVIRSDLTKEQAQSIDPYTWKKDGGYFIRLEHLAKLNAKFPPQTPLLDRTRGPATGVNPAKLRQMVESTGLEDVTVAAHAEDLPNDIFQALLSLNAVGTTRGLMMPDGRVFLIADMLGSMEEAQMVLFHEVYGHKGLRAFLGDRYVTQMALLRMANPSLAAEANTWYAAYGADHIKARMDRGVSREVAGAQIRALAVEEALSDRAGKNEPPKAWKSVMAALQKALRRMGMDDVANWLEKKTEAETYAVLMGARHAARSGATKTRGSGPALQRVWHGTPHKFDRFEMDAIGTGEGAQAYGYGLYFASKREVADWYRKKLSGGNLAAPFEKDGKTIEGMADLAEAYFKPGRIVRGYGGADKVLQFKRTDGGGWSVQVVGVKANGDAMEFERPRWHSTFPDAPMLRAVLEGDGWKRKEPGQLFEVEIPEDSDMLLWDKPLSQQTENVRRALEPFIERHKANQRKIMSAFPEAEVEREIAAGLKTITGQELYEQAGYIEAGGDRSASEYMLRLGIKGIKYLDGTSRGAGDGTYNYVIFSADDAQIQQALLKRTAPEVQTTSDAAGRPAFNGNGIVLDFPLPTERVEVIPSEGQEVLNYPIMPADSFESLGFVELLVENGKVKALLDIYVNPDARGGVGRKVIETLLAADPEASIEISNIVESARGFWASMGIPEQNRASGEAYDGTLNWQTYAQAQTENRQGTRGAGQAGRAARGRTDAAGEGGVQGAVEGGAPALSRADQTQTPEFKRWFKDSKVVDAQGRPLVVYHGTSAKAFNVFDTSSDGAHFGTSEQAASRIKKKRGGGGRTKILAVYLSLQNPLRLPDIGVWSSFNNLHSELSVNNHITPKQADEAWDAWQRTDAAGWQALKDAIVENGYDGIVYENEVEGRGDSYIALRPEQIKSAIGNRGTFDPASPSILLSQKPREPGASQPAQAQLPPGTTTVRTGSGTLTTIISPSGWRDATNRVQFAPGAWLFEGLGRLARPLLVKAGLKAASPELRRQLRAMKLSVQQAQDVAAEVARETGKLTEEQRLMVSDIIERELKTGIVPPEHAIRLAALMQQAMARQSQELVSLGMLSPETVKRWEGAYLPRFYESKLRKDVTDAWADAVRRLLGRTSTMKGIKGQHLKARGLFETIAEKDLPKYEAIGWEVRDDDYQPGLPGAEGVVQVWRDYTRAERDKMGEIRDAGFRFVMGYMQTQRDIALGRMFEAMANDPASSSRLPKEGWVRVPDTTIEGTGAKRYGKLSGRYVPKETLSHLTQIEESQSAAWQMYRKAMSWWKMGKTAMNPVSHVNNILSNLTMAHFAGVSYHRADKYIAALKDFATGAQSVKEARDAGLFLGTLSDAELMDTLPQELKDLAVKADSKAVRGARFVFDALTFFARKPMGEAYKAEDTFFRYLIYKDARARGVSADDAVDHAQRFIFTYDDLPRTARMIRDFGIPFFAYTYKAIPALLHTALTHPARFAAPAAVMWAANAMSYAIASGDEEDDWWETLQRYLTDDEFRKRVQDKEKMERELLPPWMKGATAMATPKAIRLGMDELTKLPVFIDVARIVPGGDLFDVSPNAGGLPIPQPLTPSHPLFTTAVAMIGNKDLWTGKELVDKNDTTAEATEKRSAWIWKQISPALAIGNYHFDRTMNAMAQASGGKVDWLPEFIAEDYTGRGKDGLPVQPGYAAMQTFGIKARPLDLQLSREIEESKRKQLIRGIDAELRQIRRQAAKGAISDTVAEKESKALVVKKTRVQQGLTVDGDPRD